MKIKLMLKDHFQNASVWSSSRQSGNFNRRNPDYIGISRIEIFAQRRDRPKWGVLKLALIAVILMMPACATLSVKRAAGPDEKLNAENRLMKNNLDLAMRENKVLKEENLQYKSDTTRFKKEIRSLHDDIDSLNRKYDTDMAGMTEQYNNVSDQYASLEESTGKKIQELTDRNRNLDKKMKGEISRLNAGMADQKATFEKSRLALEADFAARLSSMETSLTEKEATISSMKSMHDDALLQIGTLRKEIDSYKAAFGDIGENNKLPTESSQDVQTTTVDKVNAAAGITIEDPPISKPATAEVPAAGTPLPGALKMIRAGASAGEIFNRLDAYLRHLRSCY